MSPTKLQIGERQAHHVKPLIILHLVMCLDPRSHNNVFSTIAYWKLAVGGWTRESPVFSWFSVVGGVQRSNM